MNSLMIAFLTAFFVAFLGGFIASYPAVWMLLKRFGKRYGLWVTVDTYGVVPSILMGCVLTFFAYAQSEPLLQPVKAVAATGCGFILGFVAHPLCMFVIWFRQALLAQKKPLHHFDEF